MRLKVTRAFSPSYMYFQRQNVFWNVTNTEIVENYKTAINLYNTFNIILNG